MNFHAKTYNPKELFHSILCAVLACYIAIFTIQNPPNFGQGFSQNSTHSSPQNDMYHTDNIEFNLIQATDYGFNLAGDFKALNGLADGSLGASIAHGVIGCASAELQGSTCAQGFVTSAVTELASPIFLNGYVADESLSAAEQEAARRAYEQNSAFQFGTVVAALGSGGDASYLGIGAGLSTSATENNRWLHPEEINAITKYVDENNVSCGDVGLASGCKPDQIVSALGKEALRSVDSTWNGELEENLGAQQVLGEIRVEYGSDFVEQFGVEINFLEEDQYYDTSVPYSQYVMGNNQAFYAGGEIDGREFCQTGTDFCRNSNAEFYGTVFADWNIRSNEGGAGVITGGDPVANALRYAYNQEARSFYPSGSNNPYNNVALYDPANQQVNIVDLDGYATTMHDLGFGDVDGSNAVGVVGYGSTGQEAWDKIWHYERNYFNGEAPSLSFFQESFGSEDLYEARIFSTQCNEMGGECVTTESISKSGDWELYPGSASVFHCGDNIESCFKFVNNATGQEFVYVEGSLTNDTSLLGTYNYGPSLYTNHVTRDVIDYTDIPVVGNGLGNSPIDPMRGNGVPANIDHPSPPPNPDQM